ncbi:toxin secretion, membrane fusion protein [Laspinema olomoucense]|uniref:Toxin secretion, membrane fusion protein n=1 Tax=Laspinema olomoucense D3b TaxID=2953688 RepID=A0ABT2NAI6_9CYAN|nr:MULTISPECIES: toxin secretion, membrane fusion protein [unclassified Laspinema]MCT7972902.1 toxin secretion, membrane fusion protein [Laspinema sp. D3d]MCT7978854.1 toxin secretion, membrane fusion protein [Laspinema sp. D3b]MCT7988406.1 toxin secretion, membrane fusion protein [Laspinema sp. D3a]MCT7996449.1 toxin secretion, membrane fusion protein [Laspinema sp. D3c]
MEKVIHKTTKKQQTSDFQYWQNQPPLKRLEALEQIRREYHQYKYNAEPRLQRVYTIIKRQSS